jgi:hypothetical protein
LGCSHHPPLRVPLPRHACRGVCAFVMLFVFVCTCVCLCVYLPACLRFLFLLPYPRSHSSLPKRLNRRSPHSCRQSSAPRSISSSRPTPKSASVSRDGRRIGVRSCGASCCSARPGICTCKYFHTNHHAAQIELYSTVTVSPRIFLRYLVAIGTRWPAAFSRPKVPSCALLSCPVL